MSLGAIEGTADAVSSFVKLGSAWWSDRIGHRKAIVTLGYVLGGCTSALFVLATTAGWPVILAARGLGWFGKGIRGPLRDAILAESVSPADRGKVFGFHRTGDTLGALLGPLLAGGLLTLFPPAGPTDTAPYTLVLLLTLIPGLAAALAFALLIRERRRAPNPSAKLWASVRALPAGFRRLLVGVGVFGAGDFSHLLLILAATQLLRPVWGDYAAALGLYLYVLRNGTHALASFPVGALSDRLGRRGLLALGYALGGAVMAGFALVFATATASLALLIVLFALAGVFISIEEALERAMTADLVPDLALRNTAYGILGSVNGVGDFVSSMAVSLLWSYVPGVGFALGFGYAAVMMVLGGALVYRVR